MSVHGLGGGGIDHVLYRAIVRGQCSVVGRACGCARISVGGVAMCLMMCGCACMYWCNVLVRGQVVVAAAEKARRETAALAAAAAGAAAGAAGAPVL